MGVIGCYIRVFIYISVIDNCVLFVFVVSVWVSSVFFVYVHVCNHDIIECLCLFNIFRVAVG